MTTGDPLGQEKPAEAGAAPAVDKAAVQDNQMSDRFFLIAAKEFSSGKSKEQVVKKLTDLGVTPFDASTFADKVKAEVDKIKENEKPAMTAYIPAVLGALAAAVIGGLIWGLIAVATNTEIGYIALGIGFICAYGAILLSGNKRGLPLQIIASVMSVFGILIGKYYYYIDAVKKYAVQQFGPGSGEKINAFMPSLVSAFFQDMKPGFYDLLWVVLALSIAWTMPQSSLKQIKVK